MEVKHQSNQPAIEESGCSDSVESLRFIVILPAYNPGKDLEYCLEALAQSSYQNFDVLVVDDGSTETIKPIVERFGYQYLRIDGPGGPARARNLGVQHSKSEFVVFVDSDVCVHPDTVERMMLKFSENKDLAAVFGSYDDAPTDPGFLSQYRNIFHHYTHCHSAGEVSTFWSGCGAMRREVFIKYGGFDEKRYRCPSIEDIELGTWVTADGGRILLDPKIQCKHLKRWSLSNIVKTDIFQRGIPWIDLMLRSGKVVKTLNVKGSQRLSVVLVFTVCVLLMFAFWWPWALIGVAMAIIAVTLLNIDLYRFFLSRRGMCFTIKSLLLHWLYFVCCGISVIVGTIRFYTSSCRKFNRMEHSNIHNSEDSA